MTRATLLHVLERPTALGPAEVRELEQLAHAFPYCQTAHLLLAKAAHDQGTMLAGQRLRRAATYAADRTLLRRLIEQEEPAAAPESVVLPAPPHPLDLVDWPDEYVPPTTAPPLPVAVAAPAEPVAPIAPPPAPAPPVSSAPVVDAPVTVTETSAPPVAPVLAEVVALPEPTPTPIPEPAPVAATPPAVSIVLPEQPAPAVVAEAAVVVPDDTPAAVPVAAVPDEIAAATVVAETAAAVATVVPAEIEIPTATAVEPAAVPAVPEIEIPVAAAAEPAAVEPKPTPAASEAVAPVEAEVAPASIPEAPTPLPETLPALPVAEPTATIATVAAAVPAPAGEEPEAELPPQAPAIRPPVEVGEARFEFGLADPAPAPAAPAPAVPTYELPGLVDEWAASAVTRSLGSPDALAPAAPAPIVPVFTPAAFTGDTVVGYAFGESSRLGLSMQLLDLLAAKAEAAESATAVVAAAQPPASALPPTGTFFEPDPLLLDHWATHRPPAPELPSTVDLINNFLKRQPRLTRPAMLPPSAGGQADLSVRSTRAEPDLVSENLARIFVRQGKTARAIEIYEKLMVKQPEKMAYFAAQIQSLQPSA